MKIIFNAENNQTAERYAEIATQNGKISQQFNELELGDIIELKIPANNSIMFVYNGRNWVKLDAI